MTRQSAPGVMFAAVVAMFDVESTLGVVPARGERLYTDAGSDK